MRAEVAAGTDRLRAERQGVRAEHLRHASSRDHAHRCPAQSTTGPLFGTAYEAEVSAWTAVGPSTPLAIALAGGVY